MLIRSDHDGVQCGSNAAKHPHPIPGLPPYPSAAGMRDDVRAFPSRSPCTMANHRARQPRNLLPASNTHGVQVWMPVVASEKISPFTFGRGTVVRLRTQTR